MRKDFGKFPDRHLCARGFPHHFDKDDESNRCTRRPIPSVRPNRLMLVGVGIESPRST